MSDQFNKRLRNSRGLSLADLASATFTSRSWISNIEAGRRWPDRSWARAADEVLSANGMLLSDWEKADQRRTAQKDVAGLVTASSRESEILLAAEPDGVDVDQLGAAAARLGIDYLASPPAPMLREAIAIRDEAGRRLRAGAVRPADVSDLYLTYSRLSGVLAYAALDLGHQDVAMTHARATFKAAELAGDNQLRAWARGTQALIARFGQDYHASEAFLADGMTYAGSGTSVVRILCGAAQTAANLGDATAAMHLIEAAERARDQAGPDSVDGLFGFSPAKQAYYSGSALMWLPDHDALVRAADSAMLAIETWRHEPVEHRSLDDEALAHVYLATARLRLGEIEGAMIAIRPTLQLPADRQISWIRKRIANLSAILNEPAYKGSAMAANAVEELRSSG